MAFLDVKTGKQSGLLRAIPVKIFTKCFRLTNAQRNGKLNSTDQVQSHYKWQKIQVKSFFVGGRVVLSTELQGNQLVTKRFKSWGPSSERITIYSVSSCYGEYVY